MDIIQTYESSPETSPESSQLVVFPENRIVEHSRNTSYFRFEITPQQIRSHFTSFVMFGILFRFGEMMHLQIYRNALEGRDLYECAEHSYNLGIIDNHRDALNICNSTHYDITFLGNYIQNLPNNGYLTIDDIREIAERYPVLRNISYLITNTLFIQTFFGNVFNNISRQCENAQLVYNNQANPQQFLELVGALVVFLIIYIIFSTGLHFGSKVVCGATYFVKFVGNRFTRRTQRSHGGAKTKKSTFRPLKNSNP
jgi:hypothetical protein